MSSSAHAARLSPWARLVAVSAVLIGSCVLALAAGAIGSSKKRIVSFPVRGSLTEVDLDLGGADVLVQRGGRRMQVDVERSERYSFGKRAEVRPSVTGGVFHLRSRCPATVLHSCRVTYRIVVPDNLAIDVRTQDGSVRLQDYRGSAKVATIGGDIRIDGFCGFALQARSENGSIAARAECAPQLSLRTRTGDVHAVVPPGRYRLDAQTASGRRTVRGVTEAPDAPFSLQALSSSGNVLVEATT